MSHAQLIYESLQNRKSKVCHKSEIEDIVNEYKKIFKKKLKIKDTIKYLSRHNYIKRIFKQYYYINSTEERKSKYCVFEDKELLFSVLNKLGMSWYVGLSSAKYLSGSTWQVPTVLHIINEKYAGKRRILNVRIEFHKTKKYALEGIRGAKTKNKVPYFYSNKFKTESDQKWFGKK